MSSYLKNHGSSKFICASFANAFHRELDCTLVFSLFSFFDSEVVTIAVTVI